MVATINKGVELQHFNEYMQEVSVNGSLLPMGGILQRSAKKFPQGIALICRDRNISYHDLYYRALRFSKVLQERGLKPRDRVLLLIENSIEFYVAYYGIVQLGAVVAPLNVFLQEREVSHIMADAKPALIVTSTMFAHLFVGDNIPPILTQELMDFASPIPETFDDIDVVALEADEMAALMYTSGTTGFPKGVMLSTRNIMTSIGQGLARFRWLAEGERVFGPLPLFHSFAQNTCVWAGIFAGCTIILVPKIERKYILEGLAQQPTIFLGVPALYGLLCLLKTAPLESVKIFVSGGDALPDKIRSAFALVYQRKMCNGYGLTETSPTISVDLEDVIEPTNNVGNPVVGVECAIRDEQNNDLPRGAIGQLWVRGDNVMLGYYNAPEVTEAVIKDGWFATGDLAYIDQKGKIVISGRSKDLIIHKGINIYPQEIENVILLHSNVMRVGVIGKVDDGSGEIPIAFVQLREKDESIVMSLKELCLKNLAAYKVPRQFICSVDPLPITATGKVDKKVLRAR